MTDYDKLLNIYNEIDLLLEKRVTCSSPEFITWETRLDKFLRKQYGTESVEYENFNHTHFSSFIAVRGIDTSVQDCAAGLTKTKAKLLVYLEDIKEENRTPAVDRSAIEQITKYTSVFIVHGHDGELKEAVARLIEKQNIRAVILSEQVNCGKTIIEKMEKYGDVSAAICLFTADDTLKDNNKRARQNVVFEAGYFMGRLGREHIILVADKGVEMPSDLQGVVYSNKGNWMLDILRELKEIGYHIDYNLID